MNKKILFSPVGGTDPIKYFHDGSLLHISRFYKPDVIYLYMSHEILENHKKDNRYVKSLELLGEYIGLDFEIHIIERDDLIEAQQYDVFYEDFRNEIQKIEKTMDGTDSLIVNMASGTPGMKSALIVMATLAEYKFLPIQVSSPKRAMNSELEERAAYDVETNWDLNEDNESGCQNRCQEVQCFNLMRLLKEDMIKKHIEAYDYPAALAIAEEIQDDISEDAFRWIQIADARIKLNRKKISMLLKKNDELYPIQDGKRQKIFEYILVLKRKVDKQEYADFIRGITPIVVDVLEEILQKECNIRIEDYCYYDRNNIRKWDKGKMNGTELKEIVSKGYKREFDYDYIKSDALSKIILEKSDDKKLQQNVIDILNIEKKVRNITAHKIVSVTDEWIKQETKKSSKEILDIIRFLLRKAGINAKDEDWYSYNRMNERIIKELY